MFYQWHKEENILPIETICEIYGVSKSGYYNWLYNQINMTDKQKLLIEDEKKVMEMFRHTIKKVGHVPGKRTFKTYLDRDYDYEISVSRCSKIMKKMNLVASVPHKDAYKGQATYNHICATTQNYVKRDFKIAPRTIILTDITYLYFGFNRELFYLCTFKDAYTCEILGYALSKKMNLTLIKTAYDNMMDLHKDTFKKDVKVYIHHDCGSQYLSTTFKQILSDDNFVQSVSRRGNSQDNAPMESFFARLKTAIIDILARCSDYNTACSLVVNYLIAYNSQHYQYALGGLTPNEFYEYCVTGIYSLNNYYGISKDKLNSIKSIIDARAREAEKKREKIKQQMERRKLERGEHVDPTSIIKRDKKIIMKQIDGWKEEKELAEKEIAKYTKILDEINKAERFILSASDEVLFNLTIPTSWNNYKELQYINKMNGLF